jgi:hypothetical protein
MNAKQKSGTPDPAEGPTIAQQDWDAVRGGKFVTQRTPGNSDPRYAPEPEGELPDEDDDNPYQESDEALPDDTEEAAISRDPSKEGTRFDEV